jgi:arabinogalactan oligomer/maltooligosaccharide transport system permease protein
MTNPLAGGSDKSNVKRKTVKNLYDGGTPSLRGTLIKIGLLGIVDAVTIFVLFILWMQHQWIAFGVGLFTLLVVNFLFLRRGGLPAKYLTPGVLLLIAFQIYVLLFSAYTAFTNYGSAHNGSEEQAVSALVVQGADPVADGKQYDVHLVKEDATKKFAFLLTDPMAGDVLVATSDMKLVPLADCTTAVKEVIANNATTVDASKCELKLLTDIGPNLADAISAPGYTAVTTADFNKLSTATTNDLASRKYQLVAGDKTSQFLQTQDLATMITYQPSIIWSAGANYGDPKGYFIRVADGAKLKAAEDGFFRVDGKIPGKFGACVGGLDDPDCLNIGWQVNVGLRNFNTIFADQDLRGPLLKIISWTFIFAASTVFTTFVAGLGIALLFNDERMKGKKIYRSLMILPYAFPAFLSAYVWRGLFNKDQGFINEVILNHTHIPWLTEEVPARFAVLLVNLWLGFPYMFLITTGALQAIPAELTESATIDGATPWQILRQIKLPLLFVSLAPLLISSFAFNFNNFTLIYLLTQGGPIDSTTSGYEAGGTDILITFVYKIAFSTGHGRDYGLASAFSILIFIVVATFSLISFRRTRTLEDVN